MILRRVATAFLRQDWFTVAVETLIVVLGIFLGLQVNNWNVARLEARQGAIFAERLKEDLKIEAWNYDVMIDYLGDVQENADLALAVLEGRAGASDQQLLIYAYRATQYSGGVRRRATYDELTSTGSIALIEDPALRNTAVMVYTLPIIAQALEEGIDSPYRIAFRKSLPVEMQIALGEKCGDKFSPVGDYGVIGNQLNYACKTDFSPEQIEQAAGALRADPEIVALLRLRAMDVRTMINNLIFTNQDLMDSLHAIAGEAR